MTLPHCYLRCYKERTHLIKYSGEYSHFKCVYLAIWAVKIDKKWMFKHKLSGKFPLDFGFDIPWRQGLSRIHLCIFRADAVLDTEQTFNKCLWNQINMPQVSTRDLPAPIRQYSITIFLPNWLCDFVNWPNVLFL